MFLLLLTQCYTLTVILADTVTVTFRANRPLIPISCFIVFQESHQILPERLGPDSVQVRLLGWDGTGQVQQTGAETQFCEYTVYLRSFSSALALI